MIKIFMLFLAKPEVLSRIDSESVVYQMNLLWEALKLVTEERGRSHNCSAKYFSDRLVLQFYKEMREWERN